MNIPYIDPQDLGNPAHFKLFAANIMIFKDLLLSKQYFQAVELGTQLQADLDANPGWSKYFSIKIELTQAAIALKIEDANRISEKLKKAKKQKDLPEVEVLLTELIEIHVYLEQEHYFTQKYEPTIKKYQIWVNNQKSKEKSNVVMDIPSDSDFPLPQPIDEIEEQETQDKEQTLDKSIEYEFSDQTLKVDIPPSFFDTSRLTNAPIESEIDQEFEQQIQTELQEKLPHFKIVSLAKSTDPFMSLFGYIGIYFQTAKQICTIILIQPVPLVGTTTLRSRIQYSPVNSIIEAEINAEIQTRIIKPYLDYKHFYQLLEDNEVSNYGSRLEAELKRHFRKVRVIPTANSFTILYQYQKFALDLRAYFVLRGELEFEGNSILPGIPSIKLHFVSCRRREQWFQTLPQVQTDPAPKPDQHGQKSMDRLGNLTSTLVFCCGILQIIAYFLDSLSLFWGTLISIGGVIFMHYCIRAILIRNSQAKMSRPAAGIILPKSGAKKTQRKTSRIKNTPESMFNLLNKTHQTNPSDEFANQSVLEFLKE